MAATLELAEDRRGLRDRRRRQAALRRLETVHAELEAATRRRSELWNELARGADAELAAQIEHLSGLIASLWSEARARRACAQHGSRELILERARHELLIERDRKPKI